MCTVRFKFRIKKEVFSFSWFCGLPLSIILVHMHCLSCSLQIKLPSLPFTPFQRLFQNFKNHVIWEILVSLFLITSSTSLFCISAFLERKAKWHIKLTQMTDLVVTAVKAVLETDCSSIAYFLNGCCKLVLQSLCHIAVTSFFISLSRNRDENPSWSSPISRLPGFPPGAGS